MLVPPVLAVDADPAYATDSPRRRRELLGMKLAVKGMANRMAYLGISARVTGVKVMPLRFILLSC